MRPLTPEIAHEYDETALGSLFRITMTMGAMAVGASLCSGIISLALMV